MKRMGSASVSGMLFVAGCALIPQEVAIAEAAVSRQDKTEIVLTVMSCNADLSTTVEESTEQVVVTVTAHNDTMDDCQDLVAIELQEPLVSRDLIDGAVGEAVGVRTRDSDE